MNNIINLRQARKAKKRTINQQSAAENRVKHGRTKAEKNHDEFKAEHEQRRHDGRRLQQDGGPTKDDKTTP